jgi:hypothetical protein
MGIYLTSGNWANGCTFRVCPDADSVVPRLGPDDAAKLWGMDEDEFLAWLDFYTTVGWMTQDKAEKTMLNYFNKTLNAYKKGNCHE